MSYFCVSVPPSINRDGQSEFELAPGEVALLSCVVADSLPPPQVTWFKDGIALIPLPGRVNVLDDGRVIEIRGKEPIDSGSYECRASNEVGVDSRFYQVAILSKISVCSLILSLPQPLQPYKKAPQNSAPYRYLEK
ncbi:hypothetical protein Ciccas_002670 [Cichlidogyrus casuarinus]|uniref:Ig-like domain-containing protein n=1 Tax=Cichlidogyrus casuarinus TaxID=1844966 RepID=A0ABD2QGY2_9PLAT